MDFSLTLIIPTRNRCSSLADTLNSICKQRENVDFEVIVVDNGSVDNTKKTCADFQSVIKNLFYVYDNEPGLLTGRHHGASIARGEILCFLDDDVELNPFYVKQIVDLFEDQPNIQLATGPCLPKYEKYPPKWLDYFWGELPNGKYCSWLSLLDLGDEQIDLDQNLVWGLNFVIRKTALIDLGGFHPDLLPVEQQHFQGDGETGLTLKAIEKNYLAVYHPGLQLYHLVSDERLTKTYFKKRAYYQGVCDSFTKLRKGETKSVVRQRSLRDKLHPYYRWIKNINPKYKKNNLPEEIIEFQTALQQLYQEGFDFHQKYYATNEIVQEWVNRENYWDYQLPKL